jgi:hypothetical protein
MTIFGKLLTLFCLLAAGAFAYFAVQNRAGRQTITAAVVRHRLVVEGLPLGAEPGAPTEMPTDPDPDAEVPFPVELGGGERRSSVSRPLLEGYFQPANGGAGVLGGGGAVPNQLAEVRRVKAKVDAALAADGPKQVALLAGWLRDQPEAYEDREAFLRLREAGDADGLRARLDARFAAVLGGPRPLAAGAAAKAPEDEADPAKLRARADEVAASRAAPLGEDERRARLAHLLVHLDRDAAWQKRVLAVVGAREYARAITDQSNRVKEMLDRPGYAIPADEASYRAERADLQRLAIARTTLANNQADLRRRWEEQKRKEDDLVAQRETELKRILAQYAKVKAEVDDLLAKQAAVEAALFEVQREVAVALDRVYELYDELDARERDLLAAPRP